jgi:hypothetical protein
MVLIAAGCVSCRAGLTRLSPPADVAAIPFFGVARPLDSMEDGLDRRVTVGRALVPCRAELHASALRTMRP